MEENPSMNIKLTIAALTLLIPLTVAAGEAQAGSCGWLTSQIDCDMGEAMRQERVDALKHFDRFIAAAREEQAAEEVAHPMSDHDRERDRCYAALPQFRDGCDTRYEAEAAAAAKRASGELPQKGWRVQKSPTTP
jgi:hypothetical protein